MIQRIARPSPSAHRPARHALSLLEVVLALAILAGSFATLSQLVSLAIRAAANSRDLTQAQVIAESLMSEISAGIVQTGGAAGGATNGNLSMYPGWITQTYEQTSLHPGIIQVTIIVERDTDSWRRPRFELTRWMRDPSIEIPTEETEEVDESTEDSGSNSSSTDASGTGGGGNGTGGGGGGGGAPGGGGPGGAPGGGGPGGAPGGGAPSLGAPGRGITGGGARGGGGAAGGVGAPGRGLGGRGGPAGGPGGGRGR